MWGSVKSDIGYKKLAIVSVLLQVLNFGVPLFAIPLLITRLGLSGFGQYSLVFSWAALAMAFTEYGYAIDGIVKISAAETIKEVADKFWTIVWAKLMLALVALPFYIGFVELLSNGAIDIVYSAYGYIFIIGSTLLPTWYFYGIKKLKIYSLVMAIVRAGMFIAIVLFVNSEADLGVAIKINSIANLILGVLLFSTAAYSLKSQKITFSFYKIIESIKEGSYLFYANLGVGLYTSGNVILVNYYCGHLLAGIFAAGEKIIKASQQVFSAFTTSAIPFLTAKKSNGLMLKGMLKMQLILLIIGTAVIFALSGFIGNLLYKTNDQAIANILRIYSIVFFIGGISSAINTQVLAANGLYKKISIIVLSAGFINVGLVSLLSYLFGINGAAIAVILSETIVLLLTVNMGKKKLGAILNG